ncbi:hypothetical protein T439DRAFT_317962 [Meredithblackwellia eburnea MCA 4105]
MSIDGLDTNNASTSTSTSNSSVSGRSTPDSAIDAQAPTTTITTTTSLVNNSKQQVTSITHHGAKSVSSHINKDGTLSIKPVPAKGRSIRTKTRVHKFEPRISQFDRDNRNYQVNATGFFTLFWIMVFVGLVRTGLHNYEESGLPWGSTFARLISADALMLAVSDGVMVGSTFLCVPFVKMLNRGWIRYWWFGAFIQHVLQTLFLGVAVRWTFHREWPWVQSGFLTLHTLTMLMKVHSYCSTNGEMSDKRHRLRAAEAELESELERVGGRAQAETVAGVVWEGQNGGGGGGEGTTEIDAGKKDKDGSAKTSALSTSDVTSRDFVKPSSPSSSSSPGNLGAGGGGLRRRRGSSQALDPRGYEGESSLSVLTWHPDDKVASLAAEVAELKEALVSTGVAKVQYPQNVTWANFVDYLLVPTLVYELEYPRTDRIRPVYVMEKAAATFGTFSLLVLIVEHYILPYNPSVHEHSFLMTALDLAIPFMVNYLLIFYIIFECIANFFAEVTRFSDREFYSDWWNSVSFDEFSRRWNVPVHTFLLRHVYSTTIATYHFSKFQAAFTTFLLSAAVHELVMAVVTQKIRFYLFIMQMAQLPLIMIGRHPIFKQHPALGNLFFWLGLLSGFPLLAIGYIRY